MAEAFASGRIVDLILVLMAAEIAGLAVWRRLTGRGPRVSMLVANVLAGACLLLALRAALIGAGWMWIGAALAGSLLAHLADLYARWPRDAT